MSKINLLSQETIDKIAAGEVVEKPASIVKELVENSIDAGANAITVEIQGGGISLIRITDNGEGIEPEEIRTAFLRHATSKISSAQDLNSLHSLGFRGEALSSICAVSQVELITKCPGQLTGIRYRIEGGKEVSFEEIGAPEGSTFLIRNLFYNTPVRKKFLKTQTTEAGYITERMEQLAISHPDISFKYILNGHTKMHTSGNGRLKDILYHLYGRDITANLIQIDQKNEFMRLWGFIAKPSVSRGNRSHEHYFVNGRYIRSAIVSKAIEEAYKSYMMQHRYPFTVICMELDGTQVDVNVHPSKLEVRFSENQQIYETICAWLKETLSGKEMIPEVKSDTREEHSVEIKKEIRDKEERIAHSPEPFEKIRRSIFAENKSPYEPKYEKTPGYGYIRKLNAITETIEKSKSAAKEEISAAKPVIEKTEMPAAKPAIEKTEMPAARPAIEKTEMPAAKSVMPKTVMQDMPEGKPEQMSLFGEDDRFLAKKSAENHRIIGQLFDTYWLIEFKNQLYIMDQHAAHEKVLYERFCRKMANKEMTSQQVSPPIVVTLNPQEEALYEQYKSFFTDAGFEIEHFGGRDFAIHAVPDNLYGFSDVLLFTQMLDSLGEVSGKPSAELLYEKLASMACKAAIKGNQKISEQEVRTLVDELLSLENPYNCPHGRPTIITMTKYEIERKFKRIV